MKTSNVTIYDKLIESSYLARYGLLNTVDISDYTIFPSRAIQNSPPEFHFLPADQGDILPLLNHAVSTAANLRHPETIGSFLERCGTTAFLIIRGDRLLFEQYYNGYERSSICTSFSVAKSFVSALIGIALHEKLIQIHYNNYNLILLGMIIERVTSGTVSEYLQDKIWKPLGMEYSASWSLDSQHSGMEKMESGLNARAIDFSKFGRLYLRRGEWNGKQIVPESWIAESTTVEPDARWTNYKYLWWISRTGKGRFTAVGNLGQFIFVAPDKDCVIVRFGRGKPKDWKRVYPQLLGSLADML